ncbi:MAG: ATP-binding protein [Symploca sp. SIO2B6]|nr:ATP-binding protein [Symploca sp. SIO2B6]
MNPIKPVEFNLETPIIMGAGLGLTFAMGIGLISLGGRRRGKSEQHRQPLPPTSLPIIPPPLPTPEPVLTQSSPLSPQPQTIEAKAPQASNTPESEPEAQPEPEPSKPWQPSLESLVNEPAVLLYGAVGSGKSSKAGYLVTQHLKKGHFVEIINPLNKYKQYHPLKVWGAGNNFPEAEKGVNAFTKLAFRRLQKRAVSSYDPFGDYHHFLLLEEVTNWESKMHSLAMKNFFEACTQYLRQANMSVVLVSHGKTLTCMGGEQAGRGKKDTLLNQFIRLNCQAKQDLKVPGGKTCAGWAILEWNEGGKEQTQRVTIPHSWQPPNPAYDYSEYVQISTTKKIATIVEVEPENQAPGLGLPPHMQCLLDFCRQHFTKYNQPLKARDVQRSDWRSIREQQLTPNAIRLAFQLLAQQGYGVTNGEGLYLSFIPNIG